MKRSLMTRSVLVGLVASILLAACDEPNPPAVVNDMDQQIEVYISDDQATGSDVLALTLEQGGSQSLSGQLVATCTRETLVARSVSGTEIERREPGLCEGDVWRVNGDPDD